MPRAPKLLALVLLFACGPEGGGTMSDAGTTGANTGGEATTGDASATAQATESGTTGDETTGAGTSGATMGEGMFCEGWEGGAGPAWLELYDRAMAPLTAGATLPLECGGQGLFMFGVYPRFGGFVPTSDFVEFGIVVDVEGYNENPAGHFYSADPVAYYVGCEPVLGGVTGVLPIFPFDELPDLTVLDGRPATVQIVMHAPGGDVTTEVEVVLSVVKDDSWGFCGG